MAATETFANLPSTTVSSGGTDAPVSGTSQSWTVASSASFPAAATGVTQFHVSDPVQPSEMIAVTNVSGTTWTVTRGAESTTPVAHAAGFTVQQVVTAGGLATFVQNPMSTLGDSVYGGASGTPTRLPGNTATTQKFWGQAGNGTVSAAPAWSTVSGQYLCTPTQYAPGTQVALTTSLGTVSAVSSANVSTGSFSAPASGEVIVTTSLVLQSSASADAMAFGLCPHGSASPVFGALTVFKAPVTTQPFPYTMPFAVSGLTPAGTYNFDLMFAIAGAGTATVFAISQTGTAPSLGNAGVGSPVVMTVQAV